jgi:hypothetical protein
MSGETMSESAKKKHVLRKGVPSAKGPRKATNQKRSSKDRQDDSEDIERAVYDGMQDLRTEKPK